MAEMTKEKNSLGKMLLKSGIITQDQLDKALREQKNSNKRLGHLLIDMGLVSEDDLLKVLGEQLDTPTVNLNDMVIDPDVVKILPEKVCQQYKIVPYLLEDNTLYIAMMDPLNYQVINDIKFIAKSDVKVALASEKAILKTVLQYYGLPDQMGEMVKEVDDRILKETVQEEMDLDKLHDLAEDAPVIKIVNLVILNAVKERATDIHFEPFERVFRIRCRKDGMLHEVSSPPLVLAPAVISRIKIMAGLDIAETRLPQDGSFQKKIQNKEIDFRVSIIPNQFGERAVLRILYRTTDLFNMESLGMVGNDLIAFEEAIKMPHGIILVTGPTGSGKTTTLYAAINKINRIEHNILTVEDPVEYKMFGVGQVEVKEEIGLSFSRALRSFLRQDPDIIMVGEMRDFETADIAIRASLTGHLVFSTLHTNDAPSSITRLIDMGIEPFLINATLRIVIAQRLVRKLCENCKESYDPPKDQLRQLNLPTDGSVKFYKAKGCEICNHTMYSSRIGIFEIIVMNDKIRELVTQKAPPHLIRKIATENGMSTLLKSGISLAIRGTTSIEEILRVAFAEK